MRTLTTIGSLRGTTRGGAARYAQMRGARLTARGMSGAGTLTSSLDTAAHNLYTALATGQVTRASMPVVSEFQSAYNAAGFTPAIKVDGEYGTKETAPALQTALNLSADTPTLVAPAGFVYGSSAPTSSSSSTVHPAYTQGHPVLWLLGGALAAGLGTLAYRAMRGGRRAHQTFVIA